MIRTALALPFALLPFSSLAWAGGNGSSGTGSASAVVIAPVVVRQVSGTSINFGQFTVGQGGVVVVTPAGVGSTSGSVAFVAGSTTEAASFTVSGAPLSTFAISTGDGIVSLGSTSVPLATVPSATSGIIDIRGTYTFTVGGTLTLAGTEPPGNYAGSYVVNVQCQ